MVKKILKIKKFYKKNFMLQKKKNWDKKKIKLCGNLKKYGNINKKLYYNSKNWNFFCNNLFLIIIFTI